MANLDIKPTKLIVDDTLLQEWYDLGIEVVHANAKYVMVKPATEDIEWLSLVDILDRLELLLNADYIESSGRNLFLKWRV
jgi:hypothetical protein